MDNDKLTSLLGSIGAALRQTDPIAITSSSSGSECEIVNVEDELPENMPDLKTLRQFFITEESVLKEKRSSTLASLLELRTNYERLERSLGALPPSLRERMSAVLESNKQNQGKKESLLQDVDKSVDTIQQLKKLLLRLSNHSMNVTVTIPGQGDKTMSECVMELTLEIIRYQNSGIDSECLFSQLDLMLDTPKRDTTPLKNDESSGGNNDGEDDEGISDSGGVQTPERIEIGRLSDSGDSTDTSCKISAMQSSCSSSSPRLPSTSFPVIPPPFHATPNVVEVTSESSPKRRRIIIEEPSASESNHKTPQQTASVKSYEHSDDQHLTATSLESGEITCSTDDADDKAQSSNTDCILLPHSYSPLFDDEGLDGEFIKPDSISAASSSIISATNSATSTNIATTATNLSPPKRKIKAGESSNDDDAVEVVFNSYVTPKPPPPCVDIEDSEEEPRTSSSASSSFSRKRFNRTDELFLPRRHNSQEIDAIDTLDTLLQVNDALSPMPALVPYSRSAVDAFLHFMAHAHGEFNDMLVAYDATHPQYFNFKMFHKPGFLMGNVERQVEACCAPTVCTSLRFQVPNHSTKGPSTSSNKSPLITFRYFGYGTTPSNAVKSVIRVILADWPALKAVSSYVGSFLQSPIIPPTAAEQQQVMGGSKPPIGRPGSTYLPEAAHGIRTWKAFARYLQGSFIRLLPMGAKVPHPHGCTMHVLEHMEEYARARAQAACEDEANWKPERHAFPPIQFLDEFNRHHYDANAYRACDAYEQVFETVHRVTLICKPSIDVGVLKRTVGDGQSSEQAHKRAIINLYRDHPKVATFFKKVLL